MNAQAANLQVIYSSGHRCLQIFTAFNENVVWIRLWTNSLTWTDWKQVATDIPSFYKNYASELALSNALNSNLAFNSGSADADTITSGIHMCLGNVTNLPSGYSNYGILYTIRNSTTMCIQIYYTISAIQIYRVYANGAWGNWQEISTNIPSFYKDYNDLSSLASAVGVIPNSVFIESLPTTEFYTDRANGFGYLWVGSAKQSGILFAFHGGTAGVNILDKISALDASIYFSKQDWGALIITNAQGARLWITGY